jgi:hypothetical protein
VRDAAWLDWTAIGMGAVAVVATALSRVRARAWWVRIWDFPRLQVAALAAAALGALALARPLPGGRAGLALAALVALALAYQAALIWRYTRLAPARSSAAPRPTPAARSRSWSRTCCRPTATPTA